MKLARVAAAAGLALFAMPAGLVVHPARAQMPNINLIPELQSKTPEEKEQEAERDKAYKESLKKIPDAKTSNDPWGSVRSDPPKAANGMAKAPPSRATAPAKKTTKTATKSGSSAN